MSAYTTTSPEDILIAVLHKVGTEVRLVNDTQLAALFHEASQSTPEVFGDYAWHPQYHDSKTLRNSLQILDLGGTIIRENASIKNFYVAPRLAGEYGKKKFEALDEDVQEAVTQLAEKIKEIFRRENSSAAI